MWSWTTKKISYVGVLIATAVVFVLIGSLLFAATAYPSFKISFAGLPVKLTGYLFGPLVGAITGFLTDIISFMFLPTFYHPGYSLSMAFAGMIPGIVMWLMIRHAHSAITHFWITLLVFIVLFLFMFTLFWNLPPNKIIGTGTYKWLNDRWIYILIGTTGPVVNIICLIGLWLFASKKKFVQIAPIMLSTAILGTTTAFMLPLWDHYVLQIPYFINLVAHYLLTLPLKFLFDVVVIYFAWITISPIVQNSTMISWSAKSNIKKLE